ncbi:MAG: DUF3598 family protein [Synechococcus sp.]
MPSPEAANHDARNSLLQHNSGRWQGRFIRLDGHGQEQERFSTLLTVQESNGMIQSCLTYCNSGQQRSMTFSTLPHTMQVNKAGCWSLGPSSITPFHWVAELCVVLARQRRRVIVRHGASGLDQVVYVCEALAPSLPREPSKPLHCHKQPHGEFTIWQPEPGVQLLLDCRDRQSGDRSVCGMQWTAADGSTAQILRCYDHQGQLEELQHH